VTDNLTDDKLKWIRAFTGVAVTGVAHDETKQSSLAFRDDGPGGPSPAPPPPGGPPSNPAVDKAKADIGAKFSVTVGEKGDAQWDPSELTAVSGAFDAIPTADKAALRGAAVNRVHTFDTGKHTAADYESTVSSNDPGGSMSKTINIGDETFTDRSSRPPKPVDPRERIRKVVHEVGHAVANKKQVDADFADAQAVSALNDKAGKLKGTREQITKLEDDLQKQRVESNDLFNKHPKGADLKKLQDLDKDIQAKEQQDKALHAQADSLRTEAEAASRARDGKKAAAAANRVPQATVDAGQSQLDAAGVTAEGASWKQSTRATGYSDQDKRDSQEYRVACDAVQRELAVAAGAVKDNKVGRGEDQQAPDDLDDKLAALINARDAARKRLAARAPRNSALAAGEPVERAQNAWLEKLSTQSRLRDRTPKIQEFVQLVEREHIRPMTPYAAQSWPAKPEEFFAEAYSFFVTDPAKLQALSKDLFAWFSRGDYR
jgi:hypothetical protein